MTGMVHPNLQLEAAEERLTAWAEGGGYSERERERESSSHWVRTIANGGEGAAGSERGSRRKRGLIEKTERQLAAPYHREVRGDHETGGEERQGGRGGRGGWGKEGEWVDQRWGTAICG